MIVRLKKNYATETGLTIARHHRGTAEILGNKIKVIFNPFYGGLRIAPITVTKTEFKEMFAQVKGA